MKTKLFVIIYSSDLLLSLLQLVWSDVYNYHVFRAFYFSVPDVAQASGSSGASCRLIHGYTYPFNSGQAWIWPTGITRACRAYSQRSLWILLFNPGWTTLFLFPGFEMRRVVSYNPYFHTQQFYTLNVLYIIRAL